jgi:hypothetical protein
VNEKQVTVWIRERKHERSTARGRDQVTDSRIARSKFGEKGIWVVNCKVVACPSCWRIRFGRRCLQPDLFLADEKIRRVWSVRWVERFDELRVTNDEVNKLKPNHISEELHASTDIRYIEHDS